MTDEVEPSVAAEVDTRTAAAVAAVASASSEIIAAGVGNGLRRSKVGLVDRRLMLIYLLLAVFVVLSLFWENHQTDQVRDSQHRLSAANDKITAQQKQIVAQQAQIVAAQHAAFTVCQANDTSNASIRSVLEQLKANIINSTAQTPTQKAAALSTYATLEKGFPAIDCSHLAGQ